MGGCGGGWQRSKKTTVKDSLCLSITSLVKKKKALVAGSWTRGSFNFRRWHLANRRLKCGGSLIG